MEENMTWADECYQTKLKWIKSEDALDDAFLSTWPFKYGWERNSPKYATLNRMEVREKGNRTIHLIFYVSFNYSLIEEKIHEPISRIKDKVAYEIRRGVDLLRGDYITITHEIYYTN